MWGLCPCGVSVQESLCPRVEAPYLGEGGSLSRGSLSAGGVKDGGSLPWGLCPEGDPLPLWTE